MSAGFSDPDRQVIPRWHCFESALARKEFESLVPRTRNRPEPDNTVRKLVQEWEDTKSLHVACDLIACAFSSGCSIRIDDAAKAILASSATSELARRTASLVLYQQRSEDPLLPFGENLDGDKLMAQIHNLRAWLRDHPRNGFRWMDLARTYEILGQKEQAVSAADVAIALHPQNRFIVRSVARLHVHQNELERARRAIRDSEMARYDPWLAASEIAIATAMGRSSQIVRSARRMIESERFSYWNVGELASALGMLEFLSGNRRNARRLFDVSLIDPNENVVAQINWILRRDPSLVVAGESVYKVPYTHEARAWIAFSKSLWNEALEESVLWLKDQPFSSRPAIHASYIAATIVEDFSTAKEIAFVGLRANPMNFTLRNNLAYSLAKSGDHVAARRVFGGIVESQLEPRDRVVWMATRGLIELSAGALDEGRRLYAASINAAKKLGDKQLEARALIHWAAEEMSIGDEGAGPRVHQAISLGMASKRPDIQQIARRLMSTGKGGEKS